MSAAGVEMVTTLESCARCGGRHEGLGFRKFENPIFAPDGQHLTHFAICPTNIEPIMMRFVPAIDEGRALLPAPGQ